MSLKEYAELDTSRFKENVGIELNKDRIVLRMRLSVVLDEIIGIG